MDFLGNKYVQQKCTKCPTVYETMSIDTGPKICPSCANITIDDYIDKGMDYSKSFDECFRDQAKLVREWNDKNN